MILWHFSFKFFLLIYHWLSNGHGRFGARPFIGCLKKNSEWPRYFYCQLEAGISPPNKIKNNKV